MTDYLRRTYRLAGCFSPDEIRVLDRVLDESVSEAMIRTRDSARPIDLVEIRSSFATKILSSATTGDLDPCRLKASALSLLDGFVVSDDTALLKNRATG